MCRFTVSQQPGVDVKNEIDGFNWFDAIEEYECSDHEDQADDEQQDCTLANGGILDLWCKQIGSELGVSGSSFADGQQQLQLVCQDAYDASLQAAYQAEQLRAGSSTDSLREEQDSAEQQHGSGSTTLVEEKHNNAKHATSKKTSGKAQLAMLDEAGKVERTKQKRRESAQRSRARKNAYMKELEVENMALKVQVEQLQQMVTQLQSCITAMGTPAVGSSLPMRCC